MLGSCVHFQPKPNDNKCLLSETVETFSKHRVKEELELEDDADRVQTEAGGGGDGQRSVEAGPQHQPRPGLRQDGQTRPQVGGYLWLGIWRKLSTRPVMTILPDMLVIFDDSNFKYY